LKILGLVLVTTFLLAAPACGSGGDGQRNVFDEVSSSDSGSFPARVGEIVDIAVPTDNNQTDQRLQITKISIVDPPSGVRILSTRAYRYADSGGIGMIGGIGDLPKQCSYYRPHPVTDAVAPPHQRLNDYLVVAMTFSAPGNYAIENARIDYLLNGKPGYQVQRVAETVRVTRGPVRKIPKSACDNG
jgi:hypothetical protein